MAAASPRRLRQGPDGRTSPEAAARDLALLLVLGEMGLRSEEARLLTVSAIRAKRSDGITPWLRVHGKGDKRRDLTLGTHKNTVLYRMRGVEELLGRPVEERRLNLEIALAVVEAFGERMLPGPA